MVSTPRLRVALVGCGRFAQVHCAYLRQVPEVELVGACAPHPENRERLSRRWQVPTYGEIGELLGKTRPDVVHLLTPPATHAALAIQLLEAGVHVLVEKPMALSTPEADAMIAAADRARRWLSVNHVHWFDPVVQRARRLVESGRLGRLIGVEVFHGASAHEEHPPPGRHAEWKAALPGGVLFNRASHPAYLLRGFFDRIERVQASTRCDDRGRVREVRAVIEGQNMLGALTLSLDTQPFTKRVILYGSAMIVEADLKNMTLIAQRQRQVPRLVGKVLPNVEAAMQLLACTLGNGIEFLRGRRRTYPGMGQHFGALYRAVAAGQPPPVSAADGRDAVWLVEELWRQAGIAMVTAVRPVASG